MSVVRNYVCGREGDCEVCVHRTVVVKNKKLSHTQMIMRRNLNCCIPLPNTEVENNVAYGGWERTTLQHPEAVNKVRSLEEDSDCSFSRVSFHTR